MYYIGIDVGLNGSICILNNKGKLEKSLKMPVVKIEEGAYKHWYNLNEIIDLFNNYKDSKIILEYQRPMPGQGSASMFRLGRGFGLIIMALLGMRFPLFFVFQQVVVMLPVFRVPACATSH